MGRRLDHPDNEQQLLFEKLQEQIAVNHEKQESSTLNTAERCAEALNKIARQKRTIAKQQQAFNKLASQVADLENNLQKHPNGDRNAGVGWGSYSSHGFNNYADRNADDGWGRY